MAPSKVPPPNKRLCKKHGKPITPSCWRRGYRTTRCHECNKEYSNNPRVKERRATRYDSNDIRCKKHPDRKAQRSLYIRKRERACNWCTTHRRDGSLNPNQKRCRKRNNNKRKYKKSLKLRLQLQGKLRGFQLFSRLTGFQIPRNWTHGKD